MKINLEKARSFYTSNKKVILVIAIVSVFVCLASSFAAHGFRERGEYRGDKYGNHFGMSSRHAGYESDRDIKYMDGIAYTRIDSQFEQDIKSFFVNLIGSNNINYFKDTIATSSLPTSIVPAISTSAASDVGVSIQNASSTTAQ